MTFNSSTIPKGIKIGFTVERGELYVPAPLRCFKFQKLRHRKDICRDHKSVSNVEKRTLPIMKMNAEWKRDVQIVMRSNLHSLKHDLYKKVTEIIQVKYKRKISFPDARKIVKPYMGTQSYDSVSQKTNWIKQTGSKQENKCIELIEKLVRLRTS